MIIASHQKHYIYTMCTVNARAYLYFPVLQLSSHGRSTHVVGEVHLAEAVAVENNREHGGVTVEEVFLLIRIPVQGVFIEFCERCARPALQRVFKRFEVLSTDVDFDAFSRHFKL